MKSTFRIGINTRIVGKTKPQNLSYPGAWQSAEFTVQQLAEHIGQGQAWMPALLDGNRKRWQSNANQAEVLGLDIDEGMLIEEARRHPFISAHCALLIESASSTPQHNKFRLVFRLSQAARDWQRVRLLNKYLAHVVGHADPACKDASRFFFGAPGRKPILLNEAAILPESFIADAIAWHSQIEAESLKRAEQARQQFEALKAGGEDIEALILEALKAIPADCEYSDWIGVGMALAGMGEHWFTAWDSWSAGSASYKPREMAGKWRSFRGKRPAPEAIFGIAKRHGWKFPQRAAAVIRAAAPSEISDKPQKKPSAEALRKLRRGNTVKRAQAILSQNLPQAARETRGGYLPELPMPQAGGGLAIDANLGAGKTTAIGKLQRHLGYTPELSPRNSLGKQTANRHGLPHIHDYEASREQNELLGLDSRERGGMVLCPNSLIRASQHFPEQTALIIDEAMATLTEALEGGTLGKNWGNVIGVLIDELRRAESIVLAEANLDQATIRLVERLSGKKLQVIRHRTDQHPWQVNLQVGGSANGIRAEIKRRLLGGDRLWVTGTSVDELRRWEIWAKHNEIPYTLICGETNDNKTFDDFFNEPDHYLEQNQPQLLLTNQSVQTGLSVELPYFDHVYGYGPGFPAEVLYQQLGRYRVPCPRTVWVPAYIPPSRWEKPRRDSIRAELSGEVTRWAGGFAPTGDPDQAAIDEFLAERWQSRWAQKVIPGEALKMLLERDGHAVTVSTGQSDKPTQAEWRDLTDQLAHNRAKLQAALILEEVNTVEWAFKTLNDADASYEARCKAHKVLTVDKFPGIDWNNAEVWYQAVYRPSRKETNEAASQAPLSPGAALWAECGALETLLQDDRKKALELMEGRLKAAHLLPNRHQKVSLLAPFRPICEQLLKKGKLEPGDPLITQMAEAARELGEELTRYLRITATDDQSDMAIACKILRKFSLTLARTTYRKGKNGKRLWSYSVAAAGLWADLVEARRRALEGVTDLLEDTINKSVTALDFAELRAMVKEAKQAGRATLAELKRVFLAEFSPEIWLQITQPTEWRSA